MRILSAVDGDTMDGLSEKMMNLLPDTLMNVWEDVPEPSNLEAAESLWK